MRGLGEANSMRLMKNLHLSCGQGRIQRGGKGGSSPPYPVNSMEIRGEEEGEEEERRERRRKGEEEEEEAAPCR